MSDDQKAQQVAELIKTLYPGEKNMKQVLAGPIAKALLGPLPPYSNRDNYFLYNCTAQTAGAFIIAYANDTSRRDPVTGRMGETMVVMIERSEKDKEGNHQVGVPGGYINLDFVKKDGIKDDSRGEQPEEGAVREFGEELIGADCKPVIKLEMTRLRLLPPPGIDYRNHKKSPPVSYSSFGLELKQKELEAIKKHAERLIKDPIYAAAVDKACEGEVTKVFVKPLSEAVAMSREKFTHPHEFDALMKFQEQLKQQVAINRA